MRNRNLHKLLKTYNNKKSTLGGKAIPRENSTSQFYMVKRHENITKKDSIIIVSTPNFNALAASTVHAVN